MILALYTPLDRRQEDIRLLSFLSTQNRDDRIACTTSTYSLDECPPYVALSYEWERPEDQYQLEDQNQLQDQPDILVNGHPIAVKQNLARFLKRASKHEEIRKSLVWVDFLCINQDNNEERSHQVNLMARIYRGAQLIIAWLGPASIQGYRALECLKSFAEMLTFSSKLTVSDIDAVLQLCHSRYWSRLWILQEIVLAESCMMWIGEKGVPVNCLLALLHHASYTISSLPEGVNDTAEDEHFRALLASPASLMLAQRNCEPTRVPLLRRVLACGGFQCSEPKDKLYALLGISQPCGLIVDYNISEAELFNRFLTLSQAFDSYISLTEVHALGKYLTQITNTPGKTLFPTTSDKHPGDDILDGYITKYPLIDEESGTSLWWALAYEHTKVQQLWINASKEEVSQVLQSASRQGDVNVVQMLLDAGAYINREGGFALEAASATGHIDIVQRLLAARVRANTDIEDGCRAIPTASHFGHVKIVKMLLDAGLLASVQGMYDKNALQLASIRGFVEVVQLLIGVGVDVDSDVKGKGSALLLASRWGHEDIVKILIDAGASVNATGLQTDVTALTEALRYGHEKIVKILIHAGGEFNATMALKTASCYGHEKVVRILIDIGVDVNVRGSETYESALEIASGNGHEKTVRILIDAGADINSGGRGPYKTALGNASRYGHENIVKTLINAGADVNLGGWGPCETALGTASRHGHEKIVKILLDAGADVNASESGEYGTALEAASHYGHEKIVKLLEAAGANISLTGANFSHSSRSWTQPEDQSDDA